MNEPTITGLLQAIYDLEQRMERSFADLEAEVAEMSERLPTTIGYNPRKGKKSA